MNENNSVPVAYYWNVKNVRNVIICILLLFLISSHLSLSPLSLFSCTNLNESLFSIILICLHINLIPRLLVLSSSVEGMWSSWRHVTSLWIMWDKTCGNNVPLELFSSVELNAHINKMRFNSRSWYLEGKFFFQENYRESNWSPFWCLNY